MAEQKKSFNNISTILFVVIICFICAFILSILSSLLKKPQEDAAKLYQNKQLLISAKILNYDNSFELFKDGQTSPAIYDETSHVLIPSNRGEKATRSSVLSLYSHRIKAKLVDESGQLFSFDELHLKEQDYIEQHRKNGYSHLKYKLIYVVYPNESVIDMTQEAPVYGYVIPINGFGLWDAIYGYLCLAPDADTVIGTTWYNQKETPGLGGEIGTPKWQQQFMGKKIFMENQSGKTNFLRAPLGIKVVKTTVKETYGSSPQALSAVDGIAGATITITGVTEAYRHSLMPYRAFLVKTHNSFSK